jgi:hypothetical protein
MSTKAMSHASDLAGTEGGWLSGLLASVKQFAAAISEGREAEFTYRQLVARGMAPEKAVRQVLTEVLNRS